jgi:FkbH-like protein
MSDLTQGRLPWFCPAPADFRRIVKEFGAGDGPVSAASLIALAGHDLDIDRLTSLDRAVRKLADRIAGPELAPLKLALLAEATTDYIAPAIRASALRHGLRIETYVPAYGQAMAEALDFASPLRAFGAEMALVAETPQSLGLTRSFISPAEGEAAVAGAVAKLTALVEALQGAGIHTVILQTLPLPADPWSGSYDRRAKGALSIQIAAVNDAMAALCDSHTAVLFDAEAIAATVGRARWHDAGLWHRAKVPFALDYLPLYAEKLGQLLRALRGKASKCLVLDLDNTCWGGVIGDDGLEGIRIGQGSAEGEAFLAIHHYALSLKERGVVLAVCSKNEESNARLPFEKHPDCALKLTDFAVFAANWTDKASNLAHIAKVLNIGLDALVFLDDNPAERERVRQELPQVAVPEVGDDPALYPAMLAQGGYFETVGLSADDAQRAEQYRANAERTVAMETIGNYDDYLSSLGMVCTIQPFDAVGRTRIAQLINKSNQFNLTTRRYTEAEVAAMEANPACFTMQVRLTDKFGDNGMISVVIFHEGAHEGRPAWVCDTWLMSCRVLKRQVEEAVLATVAEAARKAGIAILVGDYLPSPKNAMVADHFPKLGFSDAGSLEQDGRRFILELDSYQAPDLPLKLVAGPRELLPIGAVA